MNAIRISVSSLLGLVITFGLVFVMFKLIDSGNDELDDEKTIKIPDFLHIERELTENMNKTETEEVVLHLPSKSMLLGGWTALA